MTLREANKPALVQRWSPQGPSTLALSTLGSVTLMRGAAPLAAPPGGKMLALLVYLALAPHQRHSRTALGELLWPHLAPEAARANLRHAFFHLRQGLDSPHKRAPLLHAGREWVGFASDAPLWVDAGEFSRGAPSCISEPNPAHCAPCIEQMESMAGLYRGEFMAGFSLPGCTDYEDWITLQRATFHQRMLTLLERLSNCHAQLGHTMPALTAARRLVEIEPWNEDGQRRIIRLLALSGQTAAALAQYEICCRILARELGVQPGAETLKLVEAIRQGRLRAESGLAALPPPTPVFPPLELTRRQVTVLSCAITPLQFDDPEDALEPLSTALTACIGTLRSHGGFVVHAHGSELLAYFGYPQAGENAAHQAVQAALALTRTGALPANLSPLVALRIGVHSGQVVSAADSPVPDPIGTTTGIALQLRQRAESGEVVISATTQHRVAGYFVSNRCGQHPLQGAREPLEIFTVQRHSGAHCRLDAAARLSPWVGRETELSRLRALWHDTRRGRRHTLLLRGVAGIGKSRLVARLQEEIPAESVLLLRCLPEFAQTPFHPLLDLIAGHPDLSSVADETTATPDARREKTFATLLDRLHRQAARGPLLLLLEDAHWIDASTLELLGRFVNHPQQEPVLVIITARPEFHALPNADPLTIIDLRPLPVAQTEALVRSLAGNLPATILRRIVERAGGIPLFAEELAWRSGSADPADIPATLHDLLAAELDALGPAKRTAQLAATIGREFDPRLLRKISAFPPLLDELQAAGLVVRAGQGHQFKHALIQEAAYQSQTKADRQAAHRRIAEVLQAQRTPTPPEILAQHWAAGGETRPAIACWIQAGKQATQHSASREAVAHFRAGLQLIPQLPAGPQRDQLEFALQAGLGVALQAAHGYGSTEATQANTRAAALSRQTADSTALFQSQWAQVMNTIAGNGSRAARAPAQQLLATAQRQADPLQRQAAHYAVANAAFWSGDFATTHTHTEHALALYQPKQHRQLLEQFGEDVSVACRAYRAWSVFFLGDPEQAQQLCRQMLEQARALAHPHTLALALCFASVLHRWLDKRAETRALAAETIAVSRQHGFPVWLAAGEMAHGWARVKQGEGEEGIAELKSGIAGMRAAIGGIAVVFLSARVEAHAHLDQPQAALDLIAEALTDAASTGDGHFTAELHRLKGECLLKISGADPSAAAACFHQALHLSRQQGARTLEQRAARSLASLNVAPWWLQSSRTNSASN